jgi:hypothetical protein
MRLKGLLTPIYKIIGGLNFPIAHCRTAPVLGTLP